MDDQHIVGETIAFFYDGLLKLNNVFSYDPWVGLGAEVTGASLNQPCLDNPAANHL